MLVVAPAGYGKTCALSQALAATSDLGVDRWVQCEPSDVDHDAFTRVVMRSLGGGVPGAGGADDHAQRIADTMASFAPDQICLVLDDVHRIPPDSSTWLLAASLIDRLPRNAHLLMSGRVTPPIPLARRHLRGVVEQLGTRDLEFDDAELTKFVDARVTSLGEAARWPAVSALSAEDTPVGPAEFLIEELISEWDDERRVVLTALAHLDDIDDEAASAASDGVWSAATTLSGLPLVQRSASNTYQLHDLWRQALTVMGADRQVAQAVRRIADLRLNAGRFIESAELYRAAGATEGLALAVAAFAAQPFMLVPASDVLRMAAIAHDALGDSPIAELLGCVHSAIVGHEMLAAERFSLVATQAAATGDVAAEALALQHAVNMYAIVDPDAIPAWLGRRAAELVAAGGPRSALTAQAMAQFHDRRVEGRSAEADETLQLITPPTNDRELVTYAFGMIALGWPERIDAMVDPVAGGPAAARLDLAAAAWLRGAVSPEVAMEMGADLLASHQRSGFAHIEVPTNATFALVALAAGDTSTARTLADEATQRAAATAAVDRHVFAQLAHAACVVGELGEAAAAEVLDAVVARRPLGAWPAEPYLFALPLVYALVPNSRATLDACRFGPALTVALNAGQALVALREQGDPQPAAALPWDRPDLLRVHVLAPHLAELAAAAAGHGHSAAALMLDVLPNAREHVLSAVDHSHAPTARWATARVATLAERPTYDLHIDVLGPLRLRRGASDVLEPEWLKRDRVRQLLAYLVVRRRAHRRAIADALWPVLDPDKAAANLRVNLAHLQRVLQPARDTGDLPWFVQSDGESLVLHGPGVMVDADRFDELQREARRCDNAGASRDAMDAHRSALTLVRGWYLEDLHDGGWAEVERLRVRTIIISSRCRLGELLLARGEPEEAGRLAGEVLAEEPLQERAGRLLVHSLAAQGDRATARRAVVDLITRLAVHDLSPEPATESVARAHGVNAPNT